MSLGYLVVLVMLAIFLIARKAQPNKNQQGGRLDPPNKNLTDKDTLTIATYNIQTGKSLTGKRNIELAAEVIANADIVGIQEVYAQSWLNKLGIGISQTEALANKGKFASLFCATRRRWFREHRGNAFLSKLPIKSWHIKMLPDQSGKSYRNMTIVELTWQAETLHVINTHLHTRKGREEQLKIVLNEFTKYPRAILMGDFNSKPDELLLLELLKSNNIIDAIDKTQIEPNPSQRIDWILTKGLKITNGRYLEKGISDHPYYEINLTINDTL